MNDENKDTFEILFLKKGTIDFCLDNMREIFNNSLLAKGKTITGKDIGKGAWLISCYGDFFFFEVGSFFDILARSFTKSQNIDDKIYFQNWIEYQIKFNKENDLIKFLSEQFKDWIKDIKNIRNKVAHLSHLYIEITHIMKIENGKFQMLTMDINKESVELMKYCNDIQKKINNILDFIEEKDYMSNRYEYLKNYLFSWDEIPGNDSIRLINFLKKKFCIDWIKTARIEKIEYDKTIKVSTEKNFLLLSLNIDRSKLNIEIDDNRTDKLIVKTENDKINIFLNN